MFEHDSPAPPHDDAFTEYLTQYVSENKLQVFEKVLAQRTRYLTVVLEDLYQAHNASACLRNCDCFGLQDVHVIENEHEFKVSRMISVGAAKWLSIHHHKMGRNNTRACLEQLRENGYRLVATSSNPAHLPLHEFEIAQPTALLFGTEKHGLSTEAVELADDFIHVPMFGFTESLNVSVACALCLQHLMWKLRQSGRDIGLSEAEKHALRSEWIRTAVGDKLDAYTRFYQSRIAPKS